MNVEVPDDQAKELIGTHQAVCTDGETATHEFVREDAKDSGEELDEADWALDKPPQSWMAKINPTSVARTL